MEPCLDNGALVRLGVFRLICPAFALPFYVTSNLNRFETAYSTDRDTVAFLASVFELTGERKRNVINVLK
jgi:hypothetical protein